MNEEHNEVVREIKKRGQDRIVDEGKDERLKDELEAAAKPDVPFPGTKEEIRGLEERTRHLTEKRDKPREEVLRLNNDLVFWMNEAEKHGCHTFLLENDRIRKGETKVKGEF